MLDTSDDSPTLIFQRLDRTAAYPHRRRDYVRRFAWLIVQALLIRTSPPRAYGWRRFWLRRFGARLDSTSATRPGTHIWHPWLLRVGPWSMLSDGVTVYNLGEVSIGAHTVLSQDVYLCAGTHDYTQPDFPLERPPIRVGSGVWVCAGAFLGPGVSVGDNSVVGARAVVMKDVPAGMVVAGNPAVVKKPRPGLAALDSGVNPQRAVELGQSGAGAGGSE